MSDTTPEVTPAATSGDKAETLRALRDRIAYELDKTRSARDVAALSKQLTDVLDALDALPNTEEVSAADDLAAKRAARRSASG